MYPNGIYHIFLDSEPLEGKLGFVRYWPGADYKNNWKPELNIYNKHGKDHYWEHIQITGIVLFLSNKVSLPTNSDLENHFLVCLLQTNQIGWISRGQVYCFSPLDDYEKWVTCMAKNYSGDPSLLLGGPR